jgi:hypothetical protein
MSVVTIFSLNDNEVETVMRVVRLWCGDRKVALESGRGVGAMATAIQLAASGIKSEQELRAALNHQLSRRWPN